jgi:hypothetical protein
VGQHNTSSNFSLPSEFKADWEDIVKTAIPDVFMDFFENPFVAVNLVQDLFLIIHAEVETQIDMTTKGLLASLGIRQNQAKAVSSYLERFYQDYSEEIFCIKEETLTEIKEKFGA